MIRDPSDGTVRAAPKAEAGKTVSRPTPGPDTGLRQPTRTEAQERLEKSREWLRDYHAKKEREHASRGDHVEGHPEDWSSSNDQGKAES